MFSAAFQDENDEVPNLRKSSKFSLWGRSWQWGWHVWGSARRDTTNRNLPIVMPLPCPSGFSFHVAPVSPLLLTAMPPQRCNRGGMKHDAVALLCISRNTAKWNNELVLWTGLMEAVFQLLTRGYWVYDVTVPWKRQWHIFRHKEPETEQ